MKKIKKDGVDYAVIEKKTEVLVPISEIAEKIAGIDAMIVATQNTLDDYKKQKTDLEKYV
jgi:hypothetical protein